MADNLINYVKFQRGTPSAYKNLSVKDEDTLYFVSEADSITGVLYLGEKLISSGNNGDIIIYYAQVAPSGITLYVDGCYLTA